jgi:hemolysin III
MSSEGRFTRGEEIANFVSHLVGASLGVIGLVLLIVFAAIKGTAWHIVSVTVFGTTIILLYLSSTLYHGLKHGKAKRVFFLFDQIAIYLLIAGSYTPIALLGVKGTLGWVMFGIEWGLAILGIVFRSVFQNDYKKGVHPLQVTAFIVMGWLALIAIEPLKKFLPDVGLGLLFAGGCFYTFGVIFFAFKKMKYNHFIWHLFVIAGTLCHYILVFKYLL